MKYFLALFITLAFPSISLATKEGILEFSKFNLSSEGLGESGPVTVSGISQKGSLKKLSVTAFGRTTELSAAQLRQLDGLLINGLQLTYDHGYKELGGRTVYILVTRGFSSGVVSKKTIEVRGNGTVEIE